MGVVTKTLQPPFTQLLDPLGQAGADSGSTRPGRGRFWIHSARPGQIQGKNRHQNFLMEFWYCSSLSSSHTPSLLWLKSLYLPPYFHRASYAPVRFGCHCLCRSIAIQYIVPVIVQACLQGEGGGVRGFSRVALYLYGTYVSHAHLEPPFGEKESQSCIQACGHH